MYNIQQALTPIEQQIANHAITVLTDLFANPDLVKEAPGLKLLDNNGQPRDTLVSLPSLFSFAYTANGMDAPILRARYAHYSYSHKQGDNALKIEFQRVTSLLKGAFGTAPRTSTNPCGRKTIETCDMMSGDPRHAVQQASYTQEMKSELITLTPVTHETYLASMRLMKRLRDTAARQAVTQG